MPTTIAAGARPREEHGGGETTGQRKGVTATARATTATAYTAAPTTTPT